jgi:hypothetical protein
MRELYWELYVVLGVVLGKLLGAAAQRGARDKGTGGRSALGRRACGLGLGGTFRGLLLAKGGRGQSEKRG